MVNNTVNGKKIGEAAGKDNKFEICSTAIQKGKQVKGINVTNKGEIKTLIKMFRKEDIVETDTHIVIKAYPGGNPNKSKNNDGEITH